MLVLPSPTRRDTSTVVRYLAAQLPAVAPFVRSPTFLLEQVCLGRQLRKSVIRA